MKMEEFVHEYYSVVKFQNAYKRVVIPLCDKSFWPEVDIGVPVGAPLGKRPMGWQQKGRFKSCLEGDSGKKTSDKYKEKMERAIYVIERIVLNVASTAHEKGNIAYSSFHTHIVLILMSTLNFKLVGKGEVRKGNGSA
jgi:hypothetical protein